MKISFFPVIQERSCSSTAFLERPSFQGVRKKKNDFSFSVCCIRLHLFLLYSSPFTQLIGGGKTTLDIMVRMLLGHIGCSLCTSPSVSTVKDLEITIASVSARSVLSDSSFRGLPCLCNNDISIVRADRICLSKTPPYGSMLGVSHAN